MRKMTQWFCQDCRVSMIIVHKKQYQVCPNCKATVAFHDTDDQFIEDEIASLMSDMAPTHQPKEVLHGGAVHLKGSSKSSKGNNEKMKKKTLATLNQQLYQNT